MQPPGTDQQINERGSAHPAEAHIYSSLGWQKKDRERNPLLSNTTFILTQTFPNSASSLPFWQSNVPSPFFCDSQTHTCGFTEASEGSLVAWWQPNQTVPAHVTAHWLKLWTKLPNTTNYCLPPPVFRKHSPLSQTPPLLKPSYFKIIKSSEALYGSTLKLTLSCFITVSPCRSVASCCTQLPFTALCSPCCSRCATPSQTLAPLGSSYVSPGRSGNTMRAAWRFSTMESGGRCVMMTSPSMPPKWCVESLASWTQRPGCLPPSTEKEKVRKSSTDEYVLVSEIWCKCFIPLLKNFGSSNKNHVVHLRWGL